MPQPTRACSRVAEQALCASARRVSKHVTRESEQGAGLELMLAVRPHGTELCGFSVEPEVRPYLSGIFGLLLSAVSEPILEGTFSSPPSA